MLDDIFDMFDRDRDRNSRSGPRKRGIGGLIQRITDSDNDNRRDYRRDSDDDRGNYRRDRDNDRSDDDYQRRDYGRRNHRRDDRDMDFDD